MVSLCLGSVLKFASRPHSQQSLHGSKMEEAGNPHISAFENFTSRIYLDPNISPENLSDWEDWEDGELNATLNMFGRDKKHLEGTAYSVILFCYVMVVTIAGKV